MKKKSISIFLIFAAILILQIFNDQGSVSAQPDTQSRSRKVFAHYMFQWGTNWIDKCYLRPLIGEYDELNPNVMEYHVLLAWAAHIDGFIMNPTFFKAGNNFQNQRVFALTNAIGRLNKKFPNCDIKYIFSYDDNNSANGDRNIIRENYLWMRDNILLHPERSKHYFHDDSTGRAVIMAWSDQGLSYHFEAIGDFFGHDSTIFFVREANNFVSSDGNFPWIAMSNCPSLRDSSTCWAKDNLDYFFTKMKSQSENKIMIGCVYPGFDDRIIHSWTPNGPWRYMKRFVTEGEVMALTWDKNINYKSTTVENPWIQITTWNDWPEGTAIEPADQKSFGYQAIQTCRKKILEFKQISTVELEDSLGLLVPYEIFQLRKRGMNARADSTLNLFMDRQYAKALQVARHITDGSVGIATSSSDSQMTVYPNPAGDILTIELTGITGKQQVQIFNETSLLVKDLEIMETKQINISDLPKGLYFIHLKNKSLQVQKFVKQ
jgi:hypothetical protein